MDQNPQDQNNPPQQPVQPAAVTPLPVDPNQPQPSANQPMQPQQPMPPAQPDMHSPQSQGKSKKMITNAKAS